MKSKYAITLLVVLFVVSAFSVNSTRQTVVSGDSAETAKSSEASEVAASPQAPSPFPNLCIAGLPDTDCCLWQIQRVVEGKREARFDDPYRCDTGGTRRGVMYIKMAVNFSGSHCDEQDIPPDKCTLEARGQVFRRDDGYAYFSGRFQITDSGGNVLFTGWMETTDRLGSHSLTERCEDCHPESHFEGWLVGQGTAALPNHTLRAFIVAKGDIPPAQGGSTSLFGTLTGTLLKCP